LPPCCRCQLSTVNAPYTKANKRRCRIASNKSEMRALDSCAASLAASVEKKEGLAAAADHLKIGDAHFSRKCYAQAVHSYQVALNIRIRLLGEGALKVANVRHSLGVALLMSSLPEQSGREGPAPTALGDTDKKKYQSAIWRATECLECSLQVRRKKLGASHIDVAETTYFLGRALTLVGDRLAEALELLHLAFRVRCSVFGQNNPLVAETLERLGAAYLKDGNYHRAIQAFAFALSVNQSLKGEDANEVAADHQALSQAYTAAGDHDKALQHSLEALTILRKRYGNSDYRTADGWLRAGRCHFARGDLRLAAKSALRAVHILSSIRELAMDVCALRLREAWTILAEARWEMQDYELAVIATIVLARGVVDSAVNYVANYVAPGEDFGGSTATASAAQTLAAATAQNHAASAAQAQAASAAHEQAASAAQTQATSAAQTAISIPGPVEDQAAGRLLHLTGMLNRVGSSLYNMPSDEAMITELWRIGNDHIQNLHHFYHGNNPRANAFERIMSESSVAVLDSEISHDFTRDPCCRDSGECPANIRVGPDDTSKIRYDMNDTNIGGGLFGPVFTCKTILVLGQTGAGKSSIVNSCLDGSTVFTLGSSQMRTTKTLSPLKAPGRGNELLLCDTPGLRNSDVDGMAVKQAMKLRKALSQGMASKIFVTIQSSAQKQALSEKLPLLNNIALGVAHHQHAFPILKVVKDRGFPPETVFAGTAAWSDRLPLAEHELGCMPEVPGFLGLIPYQDCDGRYGEFLCRLQKWQREQGGRRTYTAQEVVSRVAVGGTHSVPNGSSPSEPSVPSTPTPSLPPTSVPCERSSLDPSKPSMLSTLEPSKLSQPSARSLEPSVFPSSQARVKHPVFPFAMHRLVNLAHDRHAFSHPCATHNALAQSTIAQSHVAGAIAGASLPRAEWLNPAAAAVSCH